MQPGEELWVAPVPHLGMPEGGRGGREHEARIEFSLLPVDGGFGGGPPDIDEERSRDQQQQDGTGAEPQGWRTAAHRPAVGRDGEDRQQKEPGHDVGKEPRPEGKATTPVAERADQLPVREDHHQGDDGERAARQEAPTVHGGEQDEAEEGYVDEKSPAGTQQGRQHTFRVRCGRRCTSDSPRLHM